MEVTHFSNTMWSLLVIDHQLKIVETKNLNPALLFGIQNITGLLLPEILVNQDRQQGDLILKKIRTCLKAKRNVSFLYTVNQSSIPIQISAHIEYHAESPLLLYLTPLETEDFVDYNRVEQETTMSILFHNLFSNIEIGMEIYDAEGRLLEINSACLRAFGVRREDILGKCFFDNPFLPEDAKERLKKGENVRLTLEYDLNKTASIFGFTNDKILNIDATISVIKNTLGEITNYIIIAQDISELVELTKQYKTLYQRNQSILSTLPVGVEIISRNGDVIYANHTAYHIFGVSSQEALHLGLNINNNPVIPQGVKDAIRDGIAISTRFSYDFKKVTQAKYVPTTYSHIGEIEYKGQPLVNSLGEVDQYIIISNDVTEKIRLEEFLNQSRQKAELAMKEANIMIWEFDVYKQLFFSGNEPMNEYNQSIPITIKQYVDTVHHSNQAAIAQIMERMCLGEDFSFEFDTHILFPQYSEWQYCTISGSPYEFDANGKAIKFVGTRKNINELYKRKMLQDKILNSIPLSIHIKDVEEDFRYTFCNEESKLLFGTSEEKTTYDVMSREEVERIRKTDMEVYKTGTPYQGFENIVLKDGRSYDLIVRKSIIEDDGKRLLLSIRWDQGLQNELARRSKILEVTLETMQAYTWLYEPDNERISFGDEFNNTCNRAIEINSLQSFLSCIYPDDIELFTHSLQDVIDQKIATWDCEFRADHNGIGEYSWWQVKGVLEIVIINDKPYKYLYGMTICVEPHKQIESTLLKNKAELNQLILQNELILNNTNSGLAYITTDFVVQWENISTCSISLTHEAYQKGTFCYESAYNRTSPCENCVLQRALISRQMEQTQFTLENHRKVEVFATPVFHTDQSLNGVVIRIDDITDREKMIKELKEAKARAEQSDKLKSAFLANMSHEIRTPLNAIVGFSDLLMQTADEVDREEYMNIISTNNELLLKLINDILDLSKIEAASMEFVYETFDLSDYFDNMTSAMKLRVTNPNVRLIAINPHPVCKVKLDKNRVAQLMTNYVTNAIKYTPKGVIEMGYTCEEKGVRFYVKDTGIGIPDEKKEKVFHRFAKLDEFAQGTGLGLSICKAIAETMGGAVGFESAYGEGSLFWAFLPCTPELSSIPHSKKPINAPNTTEKTSAVTGNTQERRSILIAEDIQSNFLLISTLLKKKYNILHACNGKEAIELAQSNRIDLILMDMKMPILNGLEATQKIREFNQNVPIVALTAHAFESDRIAALDSGCNDYLVKPIDKARLMAVLRKYCPEQEGVL